MIKLTPEQQNQAIEEILRGECYFQGVMTVKTSKGVTPTGKRVRKLSPHGHPNLRSRLNEQGKGNIYNLRSENRKLNAPNN